MADKPDNQPKDAHPRVAAANAAMRSALPFADRQDYADASRGFIASLPDAQIAHASGRVVWSMKPYKFLEAEDAPATVNPSLWRQAQLNLTHGLFRVVDGIYQVRGLDIANMTIVEGKTGLIVIDTMTSTEGARAGLELYLQHRGKRPVHAVIYTHTHTDHWGGVHGVVSDEDVRAGCAIIAPDKFMEHAVSENVIAGVAMLRRAHYQFGPFLAKGPRGHVDCGLGKSMAAGTVSLIAPTDLIKVTGETRSIDGVDIVFQMAPETEAPAEMHMYFPQFRTLNMAENCTHNFHNLLPFRGAAVRDPLAWSKYINEALGFWGGQAEVLIGQHHWPVWGEERVRDYLIVQRDLYKYVHDQTVRLMNHGLTAAEIAEQVELPESVARNWHARGYYGAVRHNVKAIYQRYLGWYDANPSNLDPLPPVESAKKYVAYMGGMDALMARARGDFAAGEFRFLAQALSHAVFAEPDHAHARALLADTYEQLGYLAESATWRNAYLAGASELRFGMPSAPARTPISPATLRSLSVDQLLDYMAVRINGPQASGKRIVLNWRFTDLGLVYVLNLENGALTHRCGEAAKDAHATVIFTRPIFDAIILGDTGFEQAFTEKRIEIHGDLGKITEFRSLLDTFARMFELVEPRRARSAAS